MENNSTTTLLLKMKDAEDDKNKAMKCGKITLAVFVDISKPFDTIDFNILVWKLHKLYFSEKFLYLVLGYLSNQTHFVQIDSSYSSILFSNFSVPQGSILWPVLFNLCVADMHSCLPNCTFYNI